MDNIEDKLKNIFGKWKLKPLLFVGSGIAKRYKNMPNWDELLVEIAKHIFPDDKYYVDRQKNELKKPLKNNEINPKLGSILKDEYNKMFFDEKIDIKLQDKYEQNKKIDPFNIYLSEKLKEYKYNNIYEDEKNDFISLKNNVSNIVTTNYDCMLEDVFDFELIIGEEKIILSRFNQIGMIYKIHGCLNKPLSLVFTSEDYNSLRTKRKYFTSKLLTMFLEYPIIFIGYSLSDSDIIEMLKDIKECLPEEKLEEFGEKIIFINYVNNECKENISKTQIAGLPMYKVDLCDYKKLYQSMNEIKTTYSISTLKQISKIITDLVYSENESEEKIRVQELEKADNNEVAIFVGSKNSIFKLGYAVIDLNLIYEDNFRNNNKFDAKSLVDYTFPNIKNKTSKNRYLPLWKLTNEYGKDLPNDLKRKRLEKIEDLFTGINACETDKKKYLSKKKYTSLQQIYDENNVANKIIECAYYSCENLKIEEIKEVLEKYWDTDIRYKSNLKKLVVVYDFFKYK